jgi:hypothetical protein
MKRRLYRIGTLAVGLALIASLGIPRYSRVISSAHNFQQHFRALERSGESMGTVQRLVYSFVLANSANTSNLKTNVRQ